MKSKEQKRKEAEVRQAARDARSNAEQLKKLNQGAWAAKKERARLTKKS